MPYANDIVLIPENREDTEYFAENLDAGKVEMIINKNKSKRIKVCREERNEEPTLKVLAHLGKMKKILKFNIKLRSIILLAHV